MRQVLPRDGATLVWEYDFGDSWCHTVSVEARNEPNPDARYPQVLDGARACPPEDCGGTYGYAELLEVLPDPSHPEHEHMVGWAPPARLPCTDRTGPWARGELTAPGRTPVRAGLVRCAPGPCRCRRRSAGDRPRRV
jgi:hypothetical protein